MKYKENVRYSKYESEMKQIQAHVQSMSNTRWISVEHKMIIVISILTTTRLLLLKSEYKW